MRVFLPKPPAKNTIISLSLWVIFCSTNAQDAAQPQVDLSTGVDIYNRYVWRGLLFSDSPNVQPYMSLTWKGFNAMAWGSYALSKNYAEVDLFLSYTTHNFTIMLGDYYAENELNMASTSYMEWKDTLTPHLIEAAVMYQLPIDKFPLSITGSVFIYGADLDENNDPNYSTYFEISYPFTLSQQDCSIFIGGTTGSGYYATDAAIVNAGIKATRNIKITDAFSVPLNTSVTFHPYNKDVFFLVGISF